MAKHLIDLDEGALAAARAQLGTATIEDTVNAALLQASRDRANQIAKAFDILAEADLTDREDAWR